MVRRSSSDPGEPAGNLASWETRPTLVHPAYARAEHCPALFHCTNGKGRTGWASAAVMMLLRVFGDDAMRTSCRPTTSFSPHLNPSSRRLSVPAVGVAARTGPRRALRIPPGRVAREEELRGHRDVFLEGSRPRIRVHHALREALIGGSLMLLACGHALRSRALPGTASRIRSG